jgi:hypothetical protein
VGDELGGRGVGRKAVVLGQVAHELADLGPLAGDVEAHDRGGSGGRVDEAEEDLQERALAGAVRADEADDSRLDLEAQRVERGDVLAVALREGSGLDERHRGPSLAAGRRRGYMCGT